jgi:3-oxoadipyl-CoA thiolase
MTSREMTPGGARQADRAGRRDAYLIDGVRTPFGRLGGALASVRADDLLGHVIAALLERTGVPGERIDDVIAGCANQAGEDNRNVARMGLLLGGLPVSVPGVTVNRLCGSGMQAFADAARLIELGEADLVIAGGVEQMTRAPWVMPKPEAGAARGNQTLFDTMLGWRMVNPRMEKLHGTVALGITAENVAERCGVTRAEQDELAARSQRRAGQAIESGRLAQEIAPIQVGVEKKTGAPILFSRDEHPRPDSTVEKLASLSPAFQKDGTVTAGNSSGLNDGACAMLLASESAASKLGLRPMARYVTSAAAGVEVSYMGLGPIPATRKALERAGLGAGDIALSEVNEAFAAQAVPCIRELGLDPETVNVNGGAIAIGHPLGASGARLVLTLARELAARRERYGLATMCIGVGQGIAAILERV